MEQYEIEHRLFFQCIEKAVAQFNPECIFIRFVGSRGGEIIVSENLNGKKLSVLKKRNGLSIVINGAEKFFYETSDKLVPGKKWAVAYERRRFDSKYPLLAKTGVIHYAHCAYPNPYESYTGPDDPNLPPIYKTILRSANLCHFIEITFPGKIPIKKYRKMPGYPDWFYWTI